jgi:hypothetical protein
MRQKQTKPHAHGDARHPRRPTVLQEPDPTELGEAFVALFGDLKGVRSNRARPPRRKPRSMHERKGKPNKLPPITAYVRSLGNYYTASEVAELIGRSPAWVRKAAERRWTQAPSDVEALKKFIEHNRTVYRREDYPGNLET